MVVLGLPAMTLLLHLELLHIPPIVNSGNRSWTSSDLMPMYGQMKLLREYSGKVLTLVKSTLTGRLRACDVAEGGHKISSCPDVKLFGRICRRLQSVEV